MVENKYGFMQTHWPSLYHQKGFTPFSARDNKILDNEAFLYYKPLQAHKKDWFLFAVL
jgi:hypothetical protein